nr:UPF0606 protein KIAA1549-like [Salvelinus alpinus]
MGIEERSLTTFSTRAHATPSCGFYHPSQLRRRQYLCNVTKPDMYLVRVVLPKSGSTVGFGQVRDILKREFNRSVELQFLRTPSSFAFRVVAGPLIFTAMSVVNALRQSTQSSSLFPTVSPLYGIPDRKYQIRSVLQFVPGHVDVRVCNFSERVERGLLMAYTETRRRAHEFGNVTVQLLNITMGQAKPQGDQKVPVDITFALRDGRGYLLGSEVSGHLRRLSTVEFSFYLGFPALQIAEPFHYPELNVSHHLRSSWVRTARRPSRGKYLIQARTSLIRLTTSHQQPSYTQLRTGFRDTGRSLDEACKIPQPVESLFSDHYT